MILSKLNKYQETKVKVLKKYFGITKNPKNLNSMLVSRMLGLVGPTVNDAEEIKKANI